MLAPWLRGNDGERRWLEAFARRSGSPVPPIAPEESWRLYALSRILDLLQLSFAPPVAHPPWRVATLDRDEHARFVTALGLEMVDRPAFHPFYHEVVTVDALPDEGAAPELAGVYWPGCMLGPLVVSRAGCAVRAGRRHMRKEVAERSTLYWAFARNGRRAVDQGLGWGGNSQWRTAFRRDYALDGRLLYNVDARPHPGGADPGLTAAERAELVRHRCFVTCTKPSDDLWPYDLSLSEEA
ncbi:MAG TPA: hypothetical protein VFH27_00760 [Longimicrobiaceae bacterium]|nr:hypothetical protein [Longimicrobiaceae bacterium]